MHRLPETPPARKSRKNSSPKTPDPTRLSAVSPDDASWDHYKQLATETMNIFSDGCEWQQKKAENMETCGKYLLFGVSRDEKYKLRDARFCRTRLCPVCVPRKAMAWKARWHKAWPGLKKTAPTARYIHFVLSPPNVPVYELHDYLKKMNKAWHKMIERKGWPAIGFVRSTEVEIEKKRAGYVNAHFHVLLMVKASYFAGKNYMNNDEWRDWFAAAMGLHPEEITRPYLRAVKPGEAETAKAIKEIFKYAVKGQIPKKNGRLDWISTFLELDRQLKSTRQFALGGLIKASFSEIGEVTEEEMLAISETPEVEVVKFVEFAFSLYYKLNRVLTPEEFNAVELKYADQKRKDEALRKPLTEIIRASPEMKLDWDLNKLGLDLNIDDQKKKSVAINKQQKQDKAAAKRSAKLRENSAVMAKVRELALDRTEVSKAVLKAMEKIEKKQDRKEQDK